jgi:hypothetical protein
MAAPVRPARIRCEEYRRGSFTEALRQPQRMRARIAKVKPFCLGRSALLEQRHAILQ